ncbi:MAG: glycoside hydrolase family 18 protein [Anaerolineales bacterium]|nr:glycoside hydrolase family 18 protein [Anaerolineales bacterium]
MKRLPILLTLILLTSCGGNATPLPQTELASAQAASATPEPLPDQPTLTQEPIPPFAMIGYFPDYRELNSEWAKHLTDIIYFSAEPRADGSLDTSRLTEENWSRLIELKNQYGLRVHLSVGGWERGDDFAAMTADPGIRRQFIANLLDYMLSHEIDGVDFDWEFPQTNKEFADYVTLLAEMRLFLSEHELFVSVALPADPSIPLSEFAIVDRVHIMSYDHAERHSTYEQALKDFQLFLDAGIPAEKLVLGMPFYARGVNDFERELSYAEIVSKYRPAPEVDEVDGLFFNGITTIQQKTCFARSQNAGGVMFWELGQDTLDESSSLLRAIYKTVMSGC